MKTNDKKISSHGSINIPVAMRREMGIQGGDPMSVQMKDGSVVVTPYTPRCVFCEGTDGVGKFQGKHICKSCAQKVLDQLEGAE